MSTLPNEKRLLSGLREELTRERVAQQVEFWKELAKKNQENLDEALRRLAECRENLTRTKELVQNLWVAGSILTRDYDSICDSLEGK